MRRAYSSVGQSSGLIIRWSQVQVLVGPPNYTETRTRMARRLLRKKRTVRFRQCGLHLLLTGTLEVRIFPSTHIQTISG